MSHDAFGSLLRKIGVSYSDMLCLVFVQHRFFWIDPRLLLKHGITVRIVSNFLIAITFSSIYYIQKFVLQSNQEQIFFLLCLQIIQRPGDTVYVLPNAIHWGINLGYNMNQAVNVMSRSWALPGMLCPPRCQCAKHVDCITFVIVKYLSYYCNISVE